jgi:hypothetical protein
MLKRHIMFESDHWEEYYPGDLIEFKIESELYAFGNVINSSKQILSGIVLEVREINARSLFVFWLNSQQIIPLMLTTNNAAFMSYTVLGHVKKLI